MFSTSEIIFLPAEIMLRDQHRRPRILPRTFTKDPRNTLLRLEAASVWLLLLWDARLENNKKTVIWLWLVAGTVDVCTEHITIVLYSGAPDTRLPITHCPPRPSRREFGKVTPSTYYDQISTISIGINNTTQLYIVQPDYTNYVCRFHVISTIIIKPIDIQI